MWLRDEQSKVNVNWGGSSELRALAFFYFEAFSFRRWNVAIVWPGLNSLVTRSSFSPWQIFWRWVLCGFGLLYFAMTELTVQATNLVPQFLVTGDVPGQHLQLFESFLFLLLPLWNATKSDSIGWFSVIYDFHMTSRRPCFVPNKLRVNWADANVSFVSVEKQGYWSHEWKHSIMKISLTSPIIVINVPTRASLAVETMSLLFLWLAHLNNKSNVWKQMTCLPCATVKIILLPVRVLMM